MRSRYRSDNKLILNSRLGRRSLHQVSAGGVVFKKSSSGIRVCLIGRRKEGKIIWCLPKGHVEKGEKLSRTALREIKEETGISGSPLSSLGFIKYRFFDLESSKLVFKTVHFFLVNFIKGKLSDHDDEVEYARWFQVREALKRIEYKGEYNILKKAVKKLEQLT